MTTGLLTLHKLHGLGNDFLVALEPATELDAGIARRVCERHTGIGADGLIEGARSNSEALLTFRLWNADGGEAEMSGNGIRCLAHAALNAGWVPEGEPFSIATPAGQREVVIRRNHEATTTWGSVDMGVAKVIGEPDRCNVGHGQLLVDVGNPHLVIVGPDPATVDVAGLGAALQDLDPAGLNVEFVTLGPGPSEVTMRVFERGVGETEACGTGSCAAAVAMHHWGRVGRAVTVHQPGGPSAVEIREDGSVALAGPSVHIATCQVEVGGQ